MRKDNGTVSLVKWAVMGLLACAASFVQANTWTHSGSTITDPNGWVLYVSASTVANGLKINSDAVKTKGTPAGVLDLSGTISDGSNIVEIAVYAFRSSSAGALSSVTLPGTLVKLGDASDAGNGVFGGQTSLTNVAPLLPPSVKILGDQVFSYKPISGTVDLSSVTNLVGGMTFRGAVNITSVVFNAAVNTIPGYCFDGCTSLRSVQLPANLQTLSQNAFSGCANLPSVQLPNTLVTIGASAFQNCYILTNVTPLLPPTVTTVGSTAFYQTPLSGAADLSQVTSLADSAFRNSSGITSAVLNASLTTIQTRTFDICSNLRWVQLPPNLVTLGDYAFDNTKLGSLQLPSTLVSIGVSAFSGCTSLTNVSPLLPPTVTTVGSGAFYQAPLSGAADLSQVTSLADSAFRNSSGITSAVLNASLTTIQSRTFDTCSNLRWVQLPPSLVTLGDYAFDNTQLGSLQLPNTLVTIGLNTFAGCSILTNITPFLPATVTAVGAQAFQNCSSLTNDLVLTNGALRSISTSAFYGTKIASATLGTGVTNVYDHAFCNCSSLGWLKLPDTLQAIGQSAFLNCTSLTNVTPLLPASLTFIDQEAFHNAPVAGDLVLTNRSLVVSGTIQFQGAKLSSATLGTSVTNLPSYFLDSCSKLSRLWFRGNKASFNLYWLGNATPTNYQVRCYVPRGNSSWAAFAATGVVALTSAETNSFRANYPAEALPVGTWVTAGSQKQWYSTWVVPGSLPPGTVMLLR